MPAQRLLPANPVFAIRAAVGIVERVGRLPYGKYCARGGGTRRGIHRARGDQRRHIPGADAGVAELNEDVRVAGSDLHSATAIETHVYAGVLRIGVVGKYLERTIADRIKEKFPVAICAGAVILRLTCATETDPRPDERFAMVVDH